MKKYLLSLTLLGMGVLINAQSSKVVTAENYPFVTYSGQNVEQTIGNKKNFFTNKDKYHYTYNNFEDVYSIERNTYNDDYSRLLYSEQKQPDGNDGFYVQFKTIYHYDDKGRVYFTEQLEDEKGNGVLLKDEQMFYDFNADGTLNMTTQKMWDKDLGRYAIHERIIYYYDSGRLSYIKRQRGETYTDLFTDTYEYDGNGRLTRIVRKYVDNQEGGAYIMRNSFTYDEQGRQIKSVSEAFNVNDNTWHESSKYETRFDNDGNVIDGTSFTMNNGEWVLNDRIVPTKYNLEEFYGDTYGGQVVPSKNVVEEYDFYQYNSRFNEWKKLTHNELFYDYKVMAVKEVKENKEKVEIYPNPTKEYFSIKIQDKEATVEVYDLSGKRLKYFKNLQDKFNVSDLGKGTYVVVVKTAKKQHNLKLIKK